MKKLRPFILIVLIALAVPAFSQQLKLTISGYDVRCYHSSGGQFSFNIHLDSAGKMQGPLAIYELVQKNRKKDSVLVFRGTFLDGRLVELATWYYTSGTLMRRVNFSKVPPEGWSEKTCHYDIGNLQLCGKAEGTLTEWYEHMKDTAQQVKAICHYTGGKQNGVQQYYYPSGQLRREWNMVMGQWHGKYTQWHENGKIEEEGNYKDGFHSGPWKEYWENGNLKQTKATSAKEDTVINYYENGKIKNRTFYKGYDRHGDYFAFDSLGKVETYKHYTKGKQDSIQVAYYPSGKKAELIRFKGRDKEGSYEAWYPNGKLKLTGQHLDGNPVGIWKKYDETGKIQPIHYSTVWKETKAFNSGDYDENNPIETAMDMAVYELACTLPTIQDAGQPITVLKSDKLKFLKKYTSIDAVAVMDERGKISFRVVTLLEPAQKEQLESYLNAHYGTGRTATSGEWDKKAATCTMTVRINITAE